MSVHFRASYGTFTKFMTGGVMALTVALVFLRHESVFLMAVPGLLLLLLCVTFLFSVREYEVTADAVLIHRYFGTKSIPRSRITEVRELGKADLAGILRTFGNGGLFGYYGRFASFRLSKMTWYATRKDRVVGMFLTGGRVVVVSPDDVKEFVDSWRNEPGRLEN